MKKLLALLLAVMMVLAVFTACGDEAEGDIPTLVWYVPGDKQADIDLINAELSKITAEEIGCNVSIQFIDDGSFQERMNMNMAAGDKYDLAFVGYLNQFVDAASKGGLYPLNELLETTPDLVAQIPEYIMIQGEYDGEMYAIPNHQITSSAIAGTVPKEYADKFKAATGEDITKYTATVEYEKYFEWLKANEPNVYPVRTAYGLGTFRSMDEGIDSKYEITRTTVGAGSYTTKIDRANKTFKAVCGYEVEDESKAKMKALKLHEYYKKGWIRQDVDSVIDDTSELAQKKFGFWIGTYKPGMDGEATARYGWETLSVQLSPATMSSTAARSTMIGIGANTRYPELAIKLIEFMNTNVEAYNLVCFGIEGKHYKKVGEDRIEKLETNTGYWPNASWKFGDQFNAYKLPGQTDSVWEETRALNDAAFYDTIKNPNINNYGFEFKTDEFKPQITKIKEVETKYECRGKGSKDPNTYWDTMIKELYDAGLQAVLDEYQLQIDEFLAENPDVIEQIQW